MVQRFVTTFKIVFGLVCVLLCVFMLISYQSVLQLQYLRNQSHLYNRLFLTGENVTESNLTQFIHKNFTSKSIASKPYSAHLVVCVLSTPKNWRARNTIRKTWANVKINNTKVLFVIGLGNIENKTRNSLRKENYIHKDLVFLRYFKESYSKLTQKIIETVKLVNHNFMFDYFMKVDDDSFLRLELILKYLSQKPKHRVYWGYFTNGTPIFKTGKWAEPKRYICERYVSYAQGRGYVLSRDLVQYIAENSNKLTKFKNEDVSVGTWLVPLEIHRIHDGKFKYYGYWKAGPARNCTDNVILLHPVPIRDMEILSKRLQENGTLC